MTAQIIYSCMATNTQNPDEFYLFLVVGEDREECQRYIEEIYPPHYDIQTYIAAEIDGSSDGRTIAAGIYERVIRHPEDADSSQQ